MQATHSVEEDGENQTVISEFILVGFSNLAELQILLFVLFLMTYLVTMIGNMLIILLVKCNPSLQTPMYFFLVNLSFLEMCYTTSVVPQMLIHLLTEHKSISKVGCAAQLYVFFIVGLTECCLLAVMAYDRYVAICYPLRYMVIMNRQVCIQLAAASWATGITVEVTQISWFISLPLCGSNLIQHFFCDSPPLVKMACADTTKNEIVVLAVSVIFVMGPFFLIILSYIRIGYAILKLSSVDGRKKAFSTCSSHLMVVTLFYGTALFTYLRPKSSNTPGSDKMIALMYTVVTPVLNPIIYTLQNKEVKAAFKKTFGRIFDMQNSKM